MKKKRRYFIEPKEAISFLSEAYGLRSRELNFYCIRVSSEESDDFWDWYHTQGTLVWNHEGKNKNIGTISNAEALANTINNIIYK